MNQSKTVMALAAAALVASLSLTAEAAPKADVVAATGAPQGFDYAAASWLWLWPRHEPSS